MLFLAFLTAVAGLQLPLLAPKPVISDWTLNSKGDAGLIKVARHGQGHGHGHSELHLLAINAQYTIPPTRAGTIDPRTLVTFINDTSFVTLAPPPADDVDVWTLTRTELIYSVDAHADPPRAGGSVVLDELEIEGTPRDLVFVEALGMFVVVEDGPARIRHMDSLGLIVEELRTNGTHIVFSAHTDADSSSGVYVSDLVSPPKRLGGSGGRISSVQIASDGSVAWLEDRGKGRKVELWLYNGTASRVKTDVESSSIIFWRDGSAIALLAEQALHQMWLPIDPTNGSVPVRIPSPEPILEAVHVGITPLNHSHYIALQADQNLYVVSSNPWDRPDQGFENIQLTDFA